MQSQPCKKRQSLFGLEVRTSEHEFRVDQSFIISKKIELLGLQKTYTQSLNVNRVPSIAFSQCKMFGYWIRGSVIKVFM